MRFSGKETAGLALAQEKTTGYPCTVFAARLTDSEAIVEDFMRINLIIVGANKDDAARSGVKMIEIW